jgi:hypothetical protein
MSDAVKCESQTQPKLETTAEILRRRMMELGKLEIQSSPNAK